MTDLVLSLFPGLGLLDMAFEAEDFAVVRGPDVLWGGDIRRFHPPCGRFDGAIGGPPCQSFSSLARLVRANGHEPKFGNLIPEFERCISEAVPGWFLMENVLAAPEPIVAGYGVKSFILNNAWLLGEDGLGQEQNRVRRFSFGVRGRAAPNLMRWIDLAALLLSEASGTLTQWTPDNSPEAKRRTQQPCVTSTDGGERPSEKKTVSGCITAGHSQPAEVTERSRTRRRAVSSSNGGNGAQRQTVGAGNGGKGRYKLADACRLQGLPEDFLLDAPFTAHGKLKAVANGVPLPMGIVIARAIREALA